ncbi:MAG: RNA polymerase sigma factor [Planctomycetota bacterium]
MQVLGHGRGGWGWSDRRRGRSRKFGCGRAVLRRAAILSSCPAPAPAGAPQPMPWDVAAVRSSVTADQPKQPGTAPEAPRSPPPLHVVRSPQTAPVAGEREPEHEWAARARRGDMDAFRQLIEAFQDRVYRVVVSVLRCDKATAEDLSQEVFLRVWKGLPGFDGSSRLFAWIHTIATNVAITEYRRRRAQKRARRTLSIDAPIAGTDDLFLDPVGGERDPGDLSHQRDFLARVRACVHELPEEFRDAVVLRDLEGMSYEEIATALNLAGGTVRSRIHRGRLLLQQMLQEFEP